jgi:DNA invertase Pin-like site-specific DNA recombinase
MSQVNNNLESKRRQYGLKDLAVRFGWNEVIIIDEDLGRSGSGTHHRSGFERLIADVCAGKVGAVFALEASRLARNGHEWHRLLEICGLFSALIIDHDGTYDPQHLNDRLLLGMKGTMSEMEVSTFRQRAQEAIRQKARRGEYYTILPVGYVKREDGILVKHPNLRVQESIELVFRKFRELGSARQVYLWFHREQVELPTTQLKGKGRPIAFRLPTPTLILRFIAHPVYAGAYVFGRTKRHIKFQAGVKRAVTELRTPEQWDTLIQSHHEGYISWEEYERNQRIITQNANMKGDMVKGAARKGAALLAGIIRCGHCGHKLAVNYYGKDNTFVRYTCHLPFITGKARTCLGFAGGEAEREVGAAVLEAISPLGVEAAIQVEEDSRSKANDADRQRHLETEQARYEAQRCERQYKTVEPENRLVAMTLERLWNEALARVAELENKLSNAPVNEPILTSEKRKRLFELASDVSRVWDHPQASNQLKKRIIRSVLKEIVVFAEEGKILLMLHWQGGEHTKIELKRFKSGQHRWNSNTDLVSLVQQLARLMCDKDIATLLNRMGKRTSKGHTWSGQRVGNFRGANNIAVYQFREEQERGELSVRQVSERFGVSYMTVLRAIQKKIIPASQVCAGAPWIILSESISHLGQVNFDLLVRSKSPSPENKNQQTLNYQ